MSDDDATPHSPKEINGAHEAERRDASSDASLRKGRLRMPDFEGLPDATEEISVDFDEEGADVTYANSVLIRESPEEFVLDFIRIVPGTTEARLKSRVIVPPQNAERLFDALKERIDPADRSHEDPPPPSTDTDGPLPPANGQASASETTSGPVPTIEPELLTATFSLSGEAVYCNNPWTSILGSTDRPWARLSEEDQEMAESAVLEARKGSLATNRLVAAQTHHRKDPLPVLLDFIPVRGDSTGDAESCRAVTVTGEVLAEPPSWMLSQTQRHRMETLGRMTMGVAHDLNNLLSGLIGHIELLNEEVDRTALSDSTHSSIEAIETSAEDGAALIEKLQRYIRHDTQQHFEPVALPELIEECITLTEPYWYNEPRRQGIEISVKTSLKEVPDVLGAASELREVFVNLILNAVQAMPEGGMIRFNTFRNEEGRVCATVTDTGIGMTDEVQRNVFEPLFTTKGDEGTGMGMAASYGIVQEHEGTIEVMSEPGDGTQFTLSFPPAEGEPTPAQEPTPEATASSAPKGSSVLLVDDEEMVRTTVTRLLTLNGHSVARASSGAEALSMFTENEYDIVFTDFGMPEMTGAELSRKLKEKQPDLPVILLTGYTETKPAHDTVDGILSKPFKRDDLETAIQNHVSA